MPARGSVTILQRLLGRMVHRVDECWIYPGYCNKVTGYGNATYEGRRIEAHRATYEMLIGPVPGGLELDHLCRVRACCNPLHVEPVTHRVNLLRGESPSAHQAKQTHCLHGHELAGDNLWRDKRGRRYCIACRNHRSREYYYGCEPPPIREDRDTHCAHGHPWTEETEYRTKAGARVCRKCQTIHMRAWRDRHRRIVAQ
jgi:hypothetical protein